MRRGPKVHWVYGLGLALSGFGIGYLVRGWVGQWTPAPASRIAVDQRNSETSGGAADQLDAQVFRAPAPVLTPAPVPPSREPEELEDEWAGFPWSAPPRGLSPAEAEEWMRGHKLEYMLTSRMFLEQYLRRLETQTAEEDGQEYYGTVSMLAGSAVALLLDLQGRDRLAPQGVDVSLKSEAGTRRFLHNGWIYEVSDLEFPEFFGASSGAVFERHPETGISVPVFPPGTIEQVAYRASLAIEQFDARFPDARARVRAMHTDSARPLSSEQRATDTDH